jgi:response regulator RpfG family c-di-GMP phosphodiesterase
MLESGPLPDLCISDLTMPEVDGFQFIEQLRQNVRTRDLEIVLCTASADHDRIRKAASLHVASYLIKPFEPAKLLQEVHEILARLARKKRIELEQLKRRFGIDAGECGEIMIELSSVVRETAKELRNQLAKGNYHSARIPVTALAGTCSMLPASGLLSVVRSIEADLLREDLESAVRGLEALDSYGKDGERA